MNMDRATQGLLRLEDQQDERSCVIARHRAVGLWVFFLSLGVGCSPLPITRAERTHYRESTRYEEVVRFLEDACGRSPRLQLTTFGHTNEGRALPLVIFGELADGTPESVAAAQKTRIYVQGNIHAGEVCGKEAALMLVRDLAAGKHDGWARSLILLIAPIYNADGNERIALDNRPRQHGPVGGMGIRANAQGLDLNRDHIKLESPEARAFVGMLNKYDPHVVIDLHTTNGTHHAYHLTYSPPLHPNTSKKIVDLLRERWLPAVTEQVREQFGEEFYFYGNVPRPDGERERGWYTFDYRPRFNNNYVGLRNRIAILSEAYAYATFEERVHSTRRFVEKLVDWASANAEEIRQVVRTTRTT